MKGSLHNVALMCGLMAAASSFGAAPAESKKEAQNWPQWRGPLATGAAADANPPQTWSQSQNIKWKVKLPGRGSSTPIIWGNQIFIQTAVNTGKKAAQAAADAPTVHAAPAPPAPGGGGQRRGPGGRGGGMGVPPPTETHRFVLLCIDRQTGKTLWEKVAREELPHEGHHKDHGFSSHSPVTDGQHVYAYFGSRGLHCYDMQGNLKWQKDLGRMTTKNSFGEGSSPALHGDTIVVNWDHEGADFIAAFDKNTGQERWRQPRDEDTSWATPLVVEHGGQAQVIAAATKKVRSYDLKTGKPLWEVGPLTGNVIPTPVAGDGMVFATSGFRGSALFAIRLGGTGDLAGTNSIAWQHNKATPYVPSPLLYEGKLYFFSVNNALLSVFDAKSGKQVLETARIDALPRGVYASPVGAGGKVYLVGRDGTTVVVRHTDKLEVLATNALEENIDASPAVAGNELFLRGHEHLYCIAEK